MNKAYIVCALSILLSVSACSTSTVPTEPDQSDEEAAKAIQIGAGLVAEFGRTGYDLSSGPCVDDGRIIPGWAIDIAHDPRDAKDDLPKNQCPGYVDGSLEHLVEFTANGTLIRAL